MFKNKKNNLDNILDECLERVLIDGESIEGCLADYPEYYEELKSLLDVSSTTKKTMASIEARPEFKAKLRYEINSSLNASPATKRSVFRWQSQWATMAVSFSIVLLLAGGGMVTASNNSMPDDPLYNVKLATEQVQLFFTFSDEGKTGLYTEFVNERVNEIVNMASENNAQALGKSSKIMENQLAMLSNISATVNDFSEVVLTGETSLAAVTSTIAGSFSGTDSEGGKNITATTTTTMDYQWSAPTGATNDENRALIELIMSSYSNNIEVLNIAMKGASGDVLQALLEAIQILENGYNSTVDNIS